MSAAPSWWSGKPRKRFSDAELLTSEPVTVVLSRLGWVRAAKGHDIDARASLSYKTGDEFQGGGEGPQSAAGGVHRLHRASL